MQKFRKLMMCAMLVAVLTCMSAVVAFAENIKVGKVTCDSLNVRESSDPSAKVLTKLSKGAQVMVISQSNDWYKISCDTGKGWASTKFISTSEVVTGIVTGNSINLRKSPNLSSDVVDELEKGIKVSVLGRHENWYKVFTDEGKTGWAYKDYISIRSSNISRGAESIVPVVTPSKEESSESPSLQQQIVSYAKKYLGVRYVYGGTTPKGFDCSGFVGYVYRHFGYDLERVASDQSSEGKKVSRSDLKPGDLIFFDTSGRRGNTIDHVGIYIGDGQFIHASSGYSSHRVTITSLSKDYYENAYMTARRIIK